MRAWRAFVACVALAAYLCAGGLCGPSVLCVEEDGCITLESPGSRCCADGELAIGETPLPELADAGAASSCARCIDIPLLTEASKTGTREASSGTRTVAPQGTPAPPNDVRALSLRIENPPLPATGSTSPVLAFLSTVTLRC